MAPDHGLIRRRDAANPKPCPVALDPSRHQTPEVRRLEALLEIDERGRVTDAKIEAKLPPAPDFRITRDAGTWLFLPAAADGRAGPARVIPPINL